MARRRGSDSMRGRNVEAVPSRRLPRAHEGVLPESTEAAGLSRLLEPLGVPWGSVYPQDEFPRSTLRVYAPLSSARFPAKRFAPWKVRAPVLRAVFATVPGRQRDLKELRAPSRILFCVRRKQRREVLFAFRKAGFGGSAKKKHWYRNYSSQYRCR